MFPSNKTWERYNNGHPLFIPTFHSWNANLNRVARRPNCCMEWRTMQRHIWRYAGSWQTAMWDWLFIGGGVLDFGALKLKDLVKVLNGGDEGAKLFFTYTIWKAGMKNKSVWVEAFLPMWWLIGFVLLHRCMHRANPSLSQAAKFRAKINPKLVRRSIFREYVILDGGMGELKTRERGKKGHSLSSHTGRTMLKTSGVHCPAA